MVDSDSLVDAVSDSPSELTTPPSAPPKELIDLAPLMYFTPALLTFGAACVALGLAVYFLTSLSDLTDDLINPYTLVVCPTTTRGTAERVYSREARGRSYP